MKDWRRGAAFLGLLLLAAAGAVLLFWNLWAENAGILFHGEGRDSYLLTAKDSYDNTVCAMTRADGEYRLVFGTETGKRTEVWKIPDKVVPQDSVPVSLYESTGGLIYLGIYNTQQEETALQVYRVFHKGKEAELLLNEPCPGTSLREQMSSTRLSAFAEVNNRRV